MSSHEVSGSSLLVERLPDGAEVYVPDGVDPRVALGRTTHLVIGAHPDDVELMAWSPVLACVASEERWLTAVIASDGAGCPRAGAYATCSDDEMRRLRREEQRVAARLGGYSAVVLLGLPSASLRAPGSPEARSLLAAVVDACAPREIYTHSPLDRHATHVAVSLAVIQAVRERCSPLDLRAFLGCEVWGSLDWLAEPLRVSRDVSPGLELMPSMVACHASQIAGGKRYDLAAVGRRQANATYTDSHRCDQARATEHLIDLMPLLADPQRSVRAWVRACVERFAIEADERLAAIE